MRIIVNQLTQLCTHLAARWFLVQSTPAPLPTLTSRRPLASSFDHRKDNSSFYSSSFSLRYRNPNVIFSNSDFQIRISKSTYPNPVIPGLEVGIGLIGLESLNKAHSLRVWARKEFRGDARYESHYYLKHRYLIESTWTLISMLKAAVRLRAEFGMHY